MDFNRTRDVSRGFADPVARSVGFDGGHTGRNSMSLAFSRYYASGRFFWDERAATLEAQTLMPVQDAVEMGRGMLSDTCLFEVARAGGAPTS